MELLFLLFLLGVILCFLFVFVGLVLLGHLVCTNSWLFYLRVIRYHGLFYLCGICYRLMNCLMLFCSGEIFVVVVVEDVDFWFGIEILMWLSDLND